MFLAVHMVSSPKFLLLLRTGPPITLLLLMQVSEKPKKCPKFHASTQGGPRHNLGSSIILKVRWGSPHGDLRPLEPRTILFQWVDRVDTRV